MEKNKMKTVKLPKIQPEKITEMKQLEKRYFYKRNI